MMSSRRRTGFSEGKSAVLVYLCLKALLAHRFFNNVHSAAQDAGEAVFQLAQSAKTNKTGSGEIIAEAYRNIDIMRGILPARHRAEQGHAQHASPKEFLFMRFQGG